MKLEIAFKEDYSGKEQALRDVINDIWDNQFTISKTDDVHVLQVVLISRGKIYVEHIIADIEQLLANKGFIAIASQAS